MLIYYLLCSQFATSKTDIFGMIYTLRLPSDGVVPSPLTLSFPLTLSQRTSIECLIDLADVDCWWTVVCLSIHPSIRQSHVKTYINYYRFVDVAEITVLKSNLSVEDLEN